MENTLVIEITNSKAKDLLQQLEDLHWIKILENSSKKASPSPKKKFRGILSKEQGENLQEHIKSMRNEWGDT